MHDDTIIEAITILMSRAHNIARAHGFWNTVRNDGEAIALMHSELSEALEALRHGNPASEHVPEFTAVEEEMSDLLIRVLDYCRGHGCRLPEALIAKMEFNNTRPLKHGKKF